MKLLLGLILLSVLIAGSPFIYYSAIGFYHGYDVANAWKTFFAGTPQGTTISEDQVSTSRRTVTWVGDIENHKITEASGIAQSTLSPDVFFVINDSGNEPQLFALSPDGTDLGFWSVGVDDNVDWEDMSSFQYDNEAYLLIADTGDNFNWRPTVSLLVIREPDPETRAASAVIPVQWAFSIKYPNGYRDVEAVAVDEKNGTVLLLSKRVIPAEVYQVPLRPDKNLVMASRIALLNTIPQPNEQDRWESSRFGHTRSRPTALDIVDNTAVVFTYKDAYLFKKGWRQNWIQAFANKPVRIPLPYVNQQESGLMTKNRKHLYITTEREDGTNRAGIYKVDL